jgi:diguanylate cyclase (GGDEF)-like protein
VIPIRKSIRDSNNQVIGVMTAGIKPENLLPRLNQLQGDNDDNHYQAMLLHGEGFDTVYVSGIADADIVESTLNNPVRADMMLDHSDTLQAQMGKSLENLKTGLHSVEYFAPGDDGEMGLFSNLYIPKYKLWSLVYLPRSKLIGQLVMPVSKYVIAFFFAYTVIFFLFRYIFNVEQNRRQVLMEQADHDYLTGLNNRYSLKRREQEWINDRASPFSVMFLDLDNFKNINDSYGHSYGDVILKQVADRLRNLFVEPATVCRQGGDEFIVLSPGIDQPLLEQLALKVLSKLSEPYIVDQYSFTIGASIGICQYPLDGDSFDSLLSAADAAMYQAKNHKNDYCLFTDELRQQISTKAKIERGLHVALANNELYMVYQPQITEEGGLYGVEALLRWSNPELGITPPDQFIPIAEDNGTIIELGYFVIEQSIKDLVDFIKGSGHREIILSINVSIKQFRAVGFIQRLEALLESYDYPPQHLTLEITEGIFINDIEYMLPLFDQIRALGINLSLDDFGTGYSSLSMLKNLPINELKIDKSFIDHITDSQKDKSMVLSILNIARNANLRVVAEGIEFREQSELLTEMGCVIEQGYYHAKPLPYAQLVEYCAKFKGTVVHWNHAQCTTDPLIITHELTHTLDAKDK